MAVRLAFCGLDEVDALVGFLRDHWGREHVLVTDRRVLDWQHRDEGRGRYDVLLAWDGDEVVGILGFIPTSRYDPALADGRETVWLTTWRARDDAPTGTGLLLLRGLRERLRPVWTGTVGLRPATAGIYTRLGFRGGVLRRHVLLDHAPRDLRLARVPDPTRARLRADHPAPCPPAPVAASDVAAVAEAVLPPEHAPARSGAYYAGRYVDHPFHDYRFHHVPDDGSPGALLVTREVGHAGATAVRVVDLVGRVPIGLGGALEALRAGTDAEWIDVHAPDDRLAAAGLPAVADLDGAVVAARFAPFELRGAEPRWALDGPPDGPTGALTLSRGDADQDRPGPAATAADDADPAGAAR